MADARALVVTDDLDSGDWGYEPTSSTAAHPVVKRIFGATLGFVVLSLVVVGFLKNDSSVTHLRSGNLEDLTQLEYVEALDDPTKFCGVYPYLKFEKVLHNNLDIKGPEMGADEGIQYKVLHLGGQGAMNGKELKMTVHAVGGDYEPFSTRMNGMQGKYGSINMNSGHDIDIEFTFSDFVTGDPVFLPEAAMTFFDLDQDHGETSIESVTVDSFHKYFVMNDTEVVRVKNDDGSTTFHASTYGNGDDNPRDPMFLTAQQKNRAVSLLFKNHNKIKVNLKAGAGKGPRFYTFVGRPSLLCAVTVSNDAKPPLIDLDYEPPWEVPVEAEPHMIFVRWETEVGKPIEKGDPLCVVKDKDGKEKTYFAPADGTVKALQEGLLPGEEIDMRLSDKTLAVIKMPSLPPLPLRADTPDGRKVDNPVLTGPGMKFVKWHVGKDDPVSEGDPICDVEDEEGKITTIKAPSNGFVMSYQDHLHPQDPLDEALKGKDVAVIGLLPPIPCDEDVGEKPTNADPKAVFHKWIADVDDLVESGDPVAEVKMPDGTIKTLTAPKAGVVVHRQDGLKPGMVVEKTIEDNNLVTVGKLPALIPNPKSDVGAFAGKNMIFKKWLVNVSEIVQGPEFDTQGNIAKPGTPVAIVVDEDGVHHTIHAPKYGEVVSRQEYLKPNMKIDHTIMDDDLVVVGKFPLIEPEPWFPLQIKVNSDDGPLALPAGVSLTPEQWKECIFVQWFVEKEEKVDHNSVIAQIACGKGEGAMMLSRVADIVGTAVVDGVEDEAEKAVRKPETVNAPPGDMTFVKWETKLDTAISKDAPLCVVKDADGKETHVQAPVGGWVKSQQPLKPGDKIKKVPSGVAVIVPPLPELPTRPPTKEGREVDRQLFAPSGMRFVKWLVTLDEHVVKGAPICVVEDTLGEQKELTAPATGFVMSYQDQLEPNDPLEVALEAQDLAVIGLLPPIPCDKPKGEVPTNAAPTATFVSWDVDLFDRVNYGDAIAKVKLEDGTTKTLTAEKSGFVVARQDGLKKLEGMVVEQTIEDNNLATIGDKRLEDISAMVPKGFTRYNITAPGWGKVVKQNPLVPGQLLGDQQYGSNIVVIEQGWPWWLLLLCACLCLCCVCFPCLYWVMKKKMPYKPLAPVVVEPPPPPPVVAPPPKVEPPPPAPLPPPVPAEPDGTRLDFADPAGVIHTYYALFRPLGIKHNNLAPIVAHDFTLNAYAKLGLGVQEGYKLVKIGGADLTGPDIETDFQKVADKIEGELAKWPVWPLPMVFHEGPGGTGAEQLISFSEKPIGLTFANKAPIQIDKVFEDSPASRAGVQVGWYISKIGEKPVVDNSEFKEVIRYVGEGVKPLDLREGASQQYPLKEGITGKFSNIAGNRPQDNINR